MPRNDCQIVICYVSSCNWLRGAFVAAQVAICTKFYSGRSLTDG